jgi:RNA polymerase sigma-70 factor (ECF subfamily)
MDAPDLLAKSFDESRAQLRAVALRMLGSATEADDAMQEAWLKVMRADSHDIENLRAWLTTVVARVCLDMLRSRKSQREDPLPPSLADTADETGTPETELGLAEAIGPALLIVLDALTPAQRVAFVLHDLFELSFEEIAPIVDRTPDAARQLVSRARRRVRGGPSPSSELAHHRQLVSAFLAASRDGDLEQLIAVLSPDVVLRADPVALRAAAANPHGAPKLAPQVEGAALVADAFKGRARGALSALIDGQPGAVWAVAGQVRVAFKFSVHVRKIAAIDVVMDPDELAKLDVLIG